MKKYLIFLFVMLAATQAVYATTWRVNNNAGVSRDFVSIQEAVNAANAGDTIHVEGSVTPYDANVEIAKKLYIFGPGFHLTVNPETQHLKPSAKVNNISFIEGSAGSVLAGIEQLEVFTNGITLTLNPNNVSPFSAASISVAIGSWGGPRLIINESNIRIVNCKLNWVEINNNKNLSDIDIRKSWFCPGIVRTTGVSEVLHLSLINNFFRNDAASGTTFLVIDLHENVKASIGNNTFYGGFQINARKNCHIYNNVFYAIVNRAAAALTTDVSNTYVGNISNVTGLGGMVNGLNSNTIRPTEITESTSIEWFSASGGIAAYDKYFMANSGASSPIKQAATAAGITGELGMFCGLSPYALSGLTNIPAVYEIVMPAEVSSDGFEVTVKVRAH